MGRREFIRKLRIARRRIRELFWQFTDRRRERVDREGSQFFRYVLKNPLPPQSTLALDYEDIDERMLRYYPVDFTRVINDSSVDLDYSISPTQTFRVPQGSIQTIRNRPVTQIRLKNLDNAHAVNAGEVTLLFRKESRDWELGGTPPLD